MLTCSWCSHTYPDRHHPLEAARRPLGGRPRSSCPRCGGEPRPAPAEVGRLELAEPDPTTRSRDPFSDHLDRASAVVARWPRWKREILGRLPKDARVVIAHH